MKRFVDGLHGAVTVSCCIFTCFKWNGRKPLGSSKATLGRWVVSQNVTVVMQTCAHRFVRSLSRTDSEDGLRAGWEKAFWSTTPWWKHTRAYTVLRTFHHAIRSHV